MSQNPNLIDVLTFWCEKVIFRSQNPGYANPRAHSDTVGRFSRLSIFFCTYFCMKLTRFSGILDSSSHLRDLEGQTFCDGVAGFWAKLRVPDYRGDFKFGASRVVLLLACASLVTSKLIMIPIVGWEYILPFRITSTDQILVDCWTRYAAGWW